MLHLADEGLEAFLRAELGNGLEVAFDAPDREWGATLVRPTVNCYLWDLGPSPFESRAGVEMVDADGGRQRAAVLRRVRLRYLVTAWAKDPRDEHQLLGEALRALVRARDLPAEHLREPLASLRPLPSIALAAVDGGDRADFWTALGGRYKPGLDLYVTVTVDPGFRLDLSPIVEQVDLALADRDRPETMSTRHVVGGTAPPGTPAGARAWSPRGAATVDRWGRLVVPAEPGDDVAVEAAGPGQPPAVLPVGGDGRLRPDPEGRQP